MPAVLSVKLLLIKSIGYTDTPNQITAVGDDEIIIGY